MNVRGGIEWDRKVGVRQYYTFEYRVHSKGESNAEMVVNSDDKENCKNGICYNTETFFFSMCWRMF